MITTQQHKVYRTVCSRDPLLLWPYSVDSVREGVSCKVERSTLMTPFENRGLSKRGAVDAWAREVMISCINP